MSLISFYKCIYYVMRYIPVHVNANDIVTEEFVYFHPNCL